MQHSRRKTLSIFFIKNAFADHKQECDVEKSMVIALIPCYLTCSQVMYETDYYIVRSEAIPFAVLLYLILPLKLRQIQQKFIHHECCLQREVIVVLLHLTGSLTNIQEAVQTILTLSIMECRGSHPCVLLWCDLI